MSPSPAPTARRLVLGSTVRPLGAWPSGWRYPGAHRDPHDDPRVLVELARAAEDAGIDFLFFGDWLATTSDFEHTDPHLLARIEPFSAINYLAASTSHIGLIATINSAYAEPYSTARVAASADLLAGGRVGVNLATGADLSAARNFGWEDVHPLSSRIEVTGEFVEIMRGLWDSWDDDAFVADAESGRLIDPAKLHSLGYVGRHRASSGPLNVVRPPQGHLPVMLASSSPQAQALAARYADLIFFSPGTFDEATAWYASLKRDIAAEGRDPEAVSLLTPILPIAAATREEAWELYDRLVELVPLVDATSSGTELDLPEQRSIRSLAAALGVPLTGVLLDELVPSRLVERFSPRGEALVQIVRERSGRVVRGQRPLTYRHLLVAHAVQAPVIVGSAAGIADHLEHWFRGKATDGFTVLSAFVGAGSDAFLELVVPELRARGLVRDGYEGTTLRDNLGLARPSSRWRYATHEAASRGAD